LKKPAGSVRFQFYNKKPENLNRIELKPEKTKKNRAKPENRAKTEKTSQNQKNRAKLV